MKRNPSYSMKKGVTKKEDTWFSNAIRQRDGWKCRHCGKAVDDCNILDCAHIYSRSNMSVRWHPDNAVTLCRKPCHTKFTQEPIAWFRWLEEELGREHLDNLLTRKNQILKVNDAMKQEISDHYRIQYNSMVKSESNILLPWENGYENVRT
jgi:hypothetical protein